MVDLSPLYWKVILHLFVLPFRPKRSAEAYSRIWEGGEFPLVRITREFADKVQTYLPAEKIEVNHAFLLSSPRVRDVWDAWEQDLESSQAPATRLVILSLFPQYSESTVASSMDGFFHELIQRVKIPPFEFLTNFHKSKAFIDNSVVQIDKFLNQWKKQGRSADGLVISFHGIPKRRVLYKGDFYYRHCIETFELISHRLSEIGIEDVHMTFQSRFGSEEWLTPYTDEFCLDLVQRGKKKLAVYCPSFVADCLETVDEIGYELHQELTKQGGEVLFIPCLNTEDKWCEDFATLVYHHTESDRQTIESQYYQLEYQGEQNMPSQKMISPPLTSEAKSTLKIVFLTLFLDLVGFSIIFPLFPTLAKYYLTVDSDNVFLQLIFGTLTKWTEVGGVEIANVVLFGGALGALYSLLQFIAAPVWGSLSDRIGRRPVLIVSLIGLALSYFLWFFSGSFTLLILARFIGGIMGGNISTATAVVGDVTQRENRSKGMAIIGIAFALGFIFGPALGGLLSLIDLTLYFPTWKAYGVNPFSMPALLAFVLCLFNLGWILKKFPETLPASKRGKKMSDRSTNLFVLFKPLPYSGVNFTNFSYFLFLTAFSGMEFTLTFLAFERLGYSSLDNAYMFIFIGVLIALVQGGYVRRKAANIGEKQMALQGLGLLIPGLICIALVQSTWLLYVGLFFLSIGSAMIIPCLTALVSLYTPSEYQGKSIGIFRSLGALARVVGPIVASFLYWRWGSAYPYTLGALFLLAPMVMVARLPRPSKEEILDPSIS